MKKTQGALKGEAGFEEYYSALFGSRWPALKAALLKENSPAELKAFPEGSPYYLDAASVLAALSLPLEGAKNILDMCAAPGGKSLVISGLMDGNARLDLNEKSFERYKRLERTVQEHFSPDAKGRVHISLGDGAVLCKKAGLLYDAILLDAPCSSERHVLNDKKHLSEWSQARIKGLAVRQWALLSSAFRLLKSGGFLLYSTCAINPSENDLACGRLLKKFSDAAFAGKDELFAVQDAQKKKAARFFDLSLLPDFEEQENGFLVLPDAQGGAGPIYFSLIKKL